ncbi:coiled-coil domain-containing protein 102A-like isoform X2 [Haliotis asinina]|uniref:coiled-coil domain-containing protein 102A-like isoform X2 n=1 Tax=Haliotis asinina TaxID=109174 RepID=UPI003531BA72
MSQKMNQSLGKGDVSYIRATPTGSLPAKSPPPIPAREKNITPLSQFSGMDFELNQREEMLSKELDEARIRATQMEKTMRWWSDCTANWREKWNKARNERNKARDENRQLRSKLEAVVKECNLLKRQRQDLKSENENMKKRLNITSDEDKDKLSEASSNENTSGKDGDVCTMATEGGNQDKNDSEKETDETDVSQGKKNAGTDYTDKMEKIRENRRKMEEELLSPSDDTLMEERQAFLQMKLDEAQKTIIAERHEKTGLVKSMDKLQMEVNSMRNKYEELKKTKQQTMEQLNKVREDHKDEIGRMTLELEDENCNRSSLDRRLGELRRELERLQAENAAEWGKRERLETEKLALERDNKKLRHQMEDLEEQLERKHQQTSAMVDSDMKTLQFELSEKNKELNDLRHIHAKLKKTLQDRVTELDHTKRRAEQYELEVKKLRCRVEELKKELAGAEDEVDSQANSVRKLQRANDELQEQVDNLQVQVEHLQSRLRRNSQPMSTGRAPSLKSFTLDDPADADDSDLDDMDDMS